VSATIPHEPQTGLASGSTPSRVITKRTYRATTGTPLSMTGRAARAQVVHVQLRRPAGSMASDHVNGARPAEAGRPQTAQQVLDVMSMTVVRHRVGLATDPRQPGNNRPDRPGRSWCVRPTLPRRTREASRGAD
jgi:hypothetical protein